MVRLTTNVRCLHLGWDHRWQICVVDDVIIVTRYVHSIFFPCGGSHRQRRALARPVNIGSGRDSKTPCKFGEVRQHEVVAYYEITEHFGALPSTIKSIHVPKKGERGAAAMRWTPSKARQCKEGLSLHVANVHVTLGRLGCMDGPRKDVFKVGSQQQHQHGSVRMHSAPVIGDVKRGQDDQRSQPSNSSRKAGQKKNAHSLPSSKKTSLTMISLFQSIVTSPSISGPHACHLVVRMAPRAIVASIGSHLGNALTSTFFFGRTVSGDRFRLVINTLMR